ncbi:MAG TPA: hypothetical protein V6C82_04600, partial [Chroococcales cyanobacterium]
MRIVLFPENNRQVVQGIVVFRKSRQQVGEDRLCLFPFPRFELHLGFRIQQIGGIGMNGQFISIEAPQGLQDLHLPLSHQIGFGFDDFRSVRQAQDRSGLLLFNPINRVSAVEPFVLKGDLFMIEAGKRPIPGIRTESLPKIAILCQDEQGLDKQGKILVFDDETLHPVA